MFFILCLQQSAIDDGDDESFPSITVTVSWHMCFAVSLSNILQIQPTNAFFLHFYPPTGQLSW